MKRTLKTVAGIFAVALVLQSCSDDDNFNPSQSQPKATSPITIKARAASNPNSNQSTFAQNSAEVDQFLVNIQNIEFEYAENDNDGDDNMEEDALLSTFDEGEEEGDSQDNLNYNSLPDSIQTYLDENYPNDPFCQGEMEEDGLYKYEVELASGLEIYFTADYTVFATEESDGPCIEGSNGGNSYGSAEEVELAGPFELDLSDGEVTLVTTEIPAGTYESVEFEMGISSDASSDLYQKSILITGTISGTPFEFYSAFEEDFEIDYEDTGQNLVVDESGEASIVFNFNLDATLGAVDLSAAQDGDGDGTIEITPLGQDGNQAIADAINNALDEYTELMDD